VTVRIEGTSTERVIDARPVEHRNLPPGLDVTFEPEAVAVVIRSRAGALDDLDPSTFQPYVDLAGAGPGSHEADVAVDLPIGYTLVRIQPATVSVRIR
jgi:YbbR domain-containing protein